MEELMEILRKREFILNRMNYVDQKINFIDEGVRNRAYTAQETEIDDELEKEKAGIRKKFEEQGEKLVEAMQNLHNAKKVHTISRKKKRNTKRKRH